MLLDFTTGRQNLTMKVVIQSVDQGKVCTLSAEGVTVTLHPLCEYKVGDEMEINVTRILSPEDRTAACLGAKKDAWLMNGQVVERGTDSVLITHGGLLTRVPVTFLSKDLDADDCVLTSLSRHSPQRSGKRRTRSS